MNKRESVSSAYPGVAWQQRVANMKDEQVTAIHNRLVATYIDRQKKELLRHIEELNKYMSNTATFVDKINSIQTETELQVATTELLLVLQVYKEA